MELIEQTEDNENNRKMSREVEAIDEQEDGDQYEYDYVYLNFQGYDAFPLFDKSSEGNTSNIHSINASASKETLSDKRVSTSSIADNANADTIDSAIEETLELR